MRGCAAILALPLVLTTAGNVALAAHPSGDWLDRPQDCILRRADITSRGGKHGEVRLAGRGSVRVVQTLLYSKLLGRVVREIRERESESWPAGGEGHEASVRYVQALERAERSIPRPAVGERPSAAERRRGLLIEFALSRSAESVALLEPRVKVADGALVIVGARLIETLALPRDFVERDMRLIAEEHFPSAHDELARLIAPPGPAGYECPQREVTRVGEP